MTDALMELMEQEIALEFPSVTVTSKVCPRCEERKPIEEFYPRWKGVSPAIGGASMCKPCYRATYVGEYRKSLRLKKKGLL